jgi:phosphodiesterase/alkaline phosphatase D-like protein
MSRSVWATPARADRNRTLPELFFQETSAAWHVWFERMPEPRYADDMAHTYRSLKLGRTVELFAIDNRQYKDTNPATTAAVSSARPPRLQYNPHLKLVDMRQHGYGVLEVGQDEAKLAYRGGQVARQRRRHHQLPSPHDPRKLSHRRALIPAAVS